MYYTDPLYFCTLYRIVNKLNVNNTTKIFHKDTFTLYVYHIFIFCTIFYYIHRFRYHEIFNYFKLFQAIVTIIKSKKKKINITSMQKINSLQDYITLELKKHAGKYQS